ncbi:TetR/AcrR family transcriptional regulator [Microlunatus soli]|uniref:DNA-binding transcriptional regulator, AcrR family n=1 Tax=Microlunatus soli TaxID=630515 RepID=A0A1H2A768_9ACTN|nr:TetR/AcrR family transcriptional regulator [Microlunatus soli]SDT41821.1 DNA-binding transcriptional regulator, AcrR family [Microlunatus soli]
MRTVNPEVHAARRAEIVAAAAIEFAANGVEGTSTAAVCRRAGIGSGTLFHYFGTKQELFRAIFADDLPRITELSAAATAEADPDAGVQMITDHLIAEVADPLSPGLTSAALLQVNRDPQLAAVLTETDDLIRRALTALLRRSARKPGRSLPFRPAPTARWIQSVIDAAHLSESSNRRRTTSELRTIVGWLTGHHPL